MTLPTRLSGPFMVNFLQEPPLWGRAHWCHGVVFLTGPQYAEKQKEASVQRGETAAPKEKSFYKSHKELGAFELIESYPKEYYKYHFVIVSGEHSTLLLFSLCDMIPNQV